MSIDVLLTDLEASGGWEQCLRSLHQSGHDLKLHAVVQDEGMAGELQQLLPEVAELVADVPSSALIELLDAEPGPHGSPILVVSRPVVVPPRFLDPALAILADDLRVATVSPLTNDAGYLSFPHRNQPWTHQIDNLDEISVTRRLRERSPELLPAPVSLAVGPVTLLAGPALDALGVIPRAATGERLVGAVSLRAQRKGFLSVVDPATFYLTPHDSEPRPQSTIDVPTGLDLGDFGQVVAEEGISITTPFALVHQTCRAKALGLRIGIDGTCLGPKEMGTQVQTLRIIHALAEHDEVDSLTVALSGPIPSYARETLTHGKVKTVPSVDEDMSAIVNVDVLHRPFQPQRAIDIGAWRKVAYRAVISILDVIAYRNGAYHPSVDAWLLYRQAVRSALAEVDAATVISSDVKDQMLLERLGIDEARIHVVELGTDHVTGVEEERAPSELFARGFVGDRFLVVLGASYAHKNRDQAIRAVQELRARGHEMGLVLVGAAVPHGSSRQFEAMALDPDDPAPWLWTIPDVAPEERNWLLRHATAILYPTAAEGFGFIPFEGARFETPTVSVPFGPLVELAPDLPVNPPSWHPDDLAGAVEQLLSDPAVARQQVSAVVAAGGRYTWGQTAAKLVTMYRSLLALPGR
jgi:glycosyltransferase involved in cell wall biosynthesis